MTLKIQNFNGCVKISISDIYFLLEILKIKRKKTIVNLNVLLPIFMDTVKKVVRNFPKKQNKLTIRISYKQIYIKKINKNKKKSNNYNSLTATIFRSSSVRSKIASRRQA
jgi:uncharacterized membrane protein